jgi:hypothetical protein
MLRQASIDSVDKSTFFILQGNLAANASTFSSGIEVVADYVNGKGLKLGIYGDAGYEYSKIEKKTESCRKNDPEAMTRNSSFSLVQWIFCCKLLPNSEIKSIFLILGHEHAPL